MLKITELYPRIHVLEQKAEFNENLIEINRGKWESAPFSFPAWYNVGAKCTLVGAVKQIINDEEKIIPVTSTPHAINPDGTTEGAFGYTNFRYGFILENLMRGMKYRVIWCECDDGIALRGRRTIYDSGETELLTVEALWEGGLRPNVNHRIFYSEFTANTPWKNLLFTGPAPSDNGSWTEDYQQQLLAAVASSGRICQVGPNGDAYASKVPSPNPTSSYNLDGTLHSRTYWSAEGRCGHVSVGTIIRPTITAMPPEGEGSNEIIQHESYLSSHLEPAFSLFPNCPGYRDTPPPELGTRIGQVAS
jgi:hypothetical protein